MSVATFVDAFFQFMASTDELLEIVGIFWKLLDCVNRRTSRDQRDVFGAFFLDGVHGKTFHWRSVIEVFLVFRSVKVRSRELWQKQL